MARFEQSTRLYDQQNTYSDSEVGLTHPELSSFIRLNDAGDIEIVVNDGLAIVLHRKTQSITFVADTIKFLTKDGDSIRWNNNNLNSHATDFTQPAMVPVPVADMNSLYDGTDFYYEYEEDVEENVE